MGNALKIYLSTVYRPFSQRQSFSIKKLPLKSNTFYKISPIMYNNHVYNIVWILKNILLVLSIICFDIFICFLLIQLGENVLWIQQREIYSRENDQGVFPSLWKHLCEYLDTLRVSEYWEYCLNTENTSANIWTL